MEWTLRALKIESVFPEIVFIITFQKEISGVAMAEKIIASSSCHEVNR